MRKVVNSGSIRAAQKVGSRSAGALSQFQFNSRSNQFSTLVNKERGEETAYFRKQEAERQAQIRADLDRILALEDGHEDKQELLSVIEGKRSESNLSMCKYSCDSVLIFCCSKLDPKHRPQLNN